MKLWRYIQGNRKGKEAHQLEKEAMRDPFLADALEGYENYEGNHQREVARLQKNIIRRQKRIANKFVFHLPHNFKKWSIAAAILIAVGGGVWFYLNQPPTPTAPPSIPLTNENTPPAIAQTSEAIKTEDLAKTTPEKNPKQETTTPTVKEEEKTTETVKPDTVAKHEIADDDKDTPTVKDTSSVKQLQADREAVPTKEEATVAEARPAHPQPVAGMQTYMQYIYRNLRRPTDEECADVRGNVVVTLKIGQSGRPYNIRVTQGLCNSINQEAIRLIINGPDWVAGQTSDETSVTIPF